MLVKLWGVRGSIATPLSPTEYRNKVLAIVKKITEIGVPEASPEAFDQFLKKLSPDVQHLFGGNTTCISVQSEKSETPVILDCGTGIRALGDELMKGPCGKGRGTVKIFITHTHWDHIQGIPFFKPLYIPGNTIHFFSPIEDLKERLEAQQDDRFFPVSFDGMGAQKVFHLMRRDLPTILEEDGFTVNFHPLIHPGGSVAYKLTEGSHNFIFATDSEFTGDDLLSAKDKKEENYFNFLPFFQNADLLLLDAQYDLNESFGKFDWGHTSNTMAVNCAVHWKVKNLILTHHEPSNSDAILYGNFLDAVEHRENLKMKAPRIFLAREGMTFQVGSKSESGEEVSTGHHPTT